MRLIFTTLILMISFSCLDSNQTEKQSQEITCNDEACRGIYVGPEFINGSDVAHQLSNHMSTAVGDQLKKLYRESKYSQVDFEKIGMSTDGMGTGVVTYICYIPFKQVQDSCDAFTSFDHVGGWNHSPALSSRIKQLQPALLPGDELIISSLKTTPEGLEEHWIQWRNKRVQKGCLGVNIKEQ